MSEPEQWIEIFKHRDGTVEYVAFENTENPLLARCNHELFRDENRTLVEKKLLDYIKNHEAPIG